MSESLEAMLAAPPVRASRRLPYGAHAEQFVDLYLPSERALRHPVVIAIHGGFWRSRYDLAHLSHACAALAAEGFAVASLEYRRIGHEGGGYPGTLHDAAAGVALVQAVQDRFSLDSSRMVTLGHSAGGQLALWLAERSVGADGPPIAGVVALAPVSDLVAGHALGLGGGVIESFMGAGPEAAAAAYAVASPAARLPLGVRQVLLHGENDEEVPLSLSRGYVQHARDRGDDVQLVVLPGGDHYCVIDPRSKEWSQVVAHVREMV